MEDEIVEEQALVDLTQIEKPVAIGPEEIKDAMDIFERYREGKESLDDRIIADEELFRNRYAVIKEMDPKNIDPKSAWLFNALANKHADAMDNFPEANVLAREKGDQPVAKLLSAVIPCILKYDHFESTYRKLQDYKLKFGTGLYGIFWDKTKLHGLGDLTVQKCDILNAFWEPGVIDIQDSPNFFYVHLINNDQLLEQYPEQLEGVTLGGGGELYIKEFAYDNTMDASGKTPVFDWYYKRMKPDGGTVLHYVKYAAGVVLFATENETEAEVDEFGTVVQAPMAETGLYDHGLYPFVMDPLFGQEKSPCGLSYIDVARDPQLYIDLLDKGILENTLDNTTPRFFYRTDGGVNIEEYADFTKKFIPVAGSLDETNIKPIMGKPLPGIYPNIKEAKVDELKEVTGNRDIQTGGTTSGVTAASAIAAMQEAGSKVSRDSNKGSYIAFEQVVEQMIELIRQFYDMPRCFRIMGDQGAEEFISFSNAGMLPRPIGEMGTVDSGMWTPIFDLEVNASKKSPYSRMAQNELALQFFQMGFFNPAMSQQALACLEMMDFDRKDIIMGKIAENGAIFQAQQAMALMAGAPAEGEESPHGSAEHNADALQEPSVTRNARRRVAESTSPQ